MKTTWKKLLLDFAGDDELFSCTLSKKELNIEFVNDPYEYLDLPFLAWSTNFVYFNKETDYGWFIFRVLRNPCESIKINYQSNEN
jgi:hypothetical protein